MLENFCKKFKSPIFHSQHFEVDAEDLFESARRLNLEGIISKRKRGRTSQAALTTG